MVKLTNKKVRWIVDQVVIHHEKTDVVSVIQGISQRRVQQLVKYFKEHDEYPTLNKNRRPKSFLSDEEKTIIRESYLKTFLGARLLRIHIAKEYSRNIPQNKIHQFLIEAKFAKPNPKKQKKRKRCRYERDHSFSLLHADWTEYHDLKVIAFLDDASRNVVAIGEFQHATAENSIKTLQIAQKVAKKHCAVIQAINTDRGSQFYANAGERKKKGISQFERYLAKCGINHIVSRKNNPQTNGKIERWFQEYKKHRHRFSSGEKFINWYNNRLHGSLMLEWGETPNEAILRKLPPESLLGLFLSMNKGE